MTQLTLGVAVSPHCSPMRNEKGQRKLAFLLKIHCFGGQERGFSRPECRYRDTLCASLGSYDRKSNTKIL